MGSKKRKQISFLVTEDMINFLNVRAKAVGNRSEYLRHLVLQDMFGRDSRYVTAKEREEQLDNLSIEDRSTHRDLRNELKDALRGGVSGLLKPPKDEKDNDSC